MEFTEIKGNDRGEVVLYALSTCIWCKKTKELLESLGVAYRYVYVDLLQGGEREEARAGIMKWNPDCSFPTVVIGGSTCIVGYDEEKIRGALGL